MAAPTRHSRSSITAREFAPLTRSSHDTPKRRGVGTDALDFGCKLPYLAGLLPGAGYVEPGSTAGLVVDVRTRQEAECRW